MKWHLALLAILQLSVGLSHGQGLPDLTQAPPRKISPALIDLPHFESGAIIPGLREGAVPQGLAYSEKFEVIFISHYFDSDRASRVSSIDHRTGRLIHSRSLKEDESNQHFGHVGGVAVENEHIWISSAGYVYRYRLSDLLDAATSSSMIPLSRHKVETKASFCSYYKGILFVGEFGYGSKFQTHRSHHLDDRQGHMKKSWICGYDISKEFTTPSSILSIPQKVQGVHISHPYVFLSISYGRRNRSKIEVYYNPLNEPPHKMVKLVSGKRTPLWFLDGGNWFKSIDFAPMSEGITEIDGKIAVLCESGATKFRFGGKGPVDRIIMVDKHMMLR